MAGHGHVIMMRGAQRIMQAMIEKATELGLTDGAVVFQAFDDVDRMYGQESMYALLGDPRSWSRVNHLAVAQAGFSHCRIHKTDSGVTDFSAVYSIPVGEMAEEGAIIRMYEGTHLILSFAGGSGEQNVAVALAGYEEFLRLFS